MNKKIILSALLIIVFQMIMGLFWLGLLTFLLIITYFGVLKLIHLVKSTFLKKVTKGVFLLFFVFTIAISVKLFFFDIFIVPSPSMKGALFPNDIILVNKLKYGPRLPNSPFEIPWVNLVFYANNKARKRAKEAWWNYKRLSGTTPIKQGDIFVFNLGTPRNFVVVKRCMGLAGDTLSVKDAEVYINNDLFISPGTVKNNYKFIVKNEKNFDKAIDSLALDTIFKLNRIEKFTGLRLSKLEFMQLKKLNCIDSLQKQIDTFNIKKRIFPYYPNSKWTLDNMGPIIIPKKGMKVTLNFNTYLLYKTIINRYENTTISYKEGFCYLNGKKAATYTFLQDYYFMMGDNRKETMDSRIWGFIPESSIIGKVQCVLFSNYKNAFRWDRLFKSVN